MDAVKVVLGDGAYMPVRGHGADAGLDLRVPYTISIAPGDSALVDTGVHMMIPVGYCGLLVSKSGLYTLKACTTTGLIDANFTGTIMVRIVNHGENEVLLKKGDKITQVVFLKCETPKLELDVVQKAGLRGDNGYGSTGR